MKTQIIIALLMLWSGVCIWIGAASEIGKPPPPPYRIVRPEFQPAGLQVDCKEALRICRQRLKSNATKGLN